MEERAACAQLKRRFEAAGFRIKENQTFNEDGVWFEIDGFDAERRVGYEYLTEEAGDGWDVDGDVIAALEERRKRGDLHVLVVDETDAPDAAALDEAIDAFLGSLPPRSEPAAAPKAGADADGEDLDVDTDALADDADDLDELDADADDADDDAADELDADLIEEAADAPADATKSPAAGKPPAAAAKPPVAGKPPAAKPPAKPPAKPAKSTRPPPTPKGAKKKPARKSR